MAGFFGFFKSNDELVDISIIDHTGKIAARLENVVESRMEKAAKDLQRRVQSHFLSASGKKNSSRPGQYPKYINKHGANSIHVEKVEGKNVIRATYAGSKPRYLLRLRNLSADVSIKPKNKRSLAIPLTPEAKVFSSNNDGSKTVRDFRPGGKEMEVKTYKSGRTFLSTRNSGPRRMFTGKEYTNHFLLTKNTVNRQARKGVHHAMREEESRFVKYITKSVESEFGAP
jgi:hypothetical protein